MPAAAPSRRRSRHSPLTPAPRSWTHLPRGTYLLLSPHAERSGGYEYRAKVPPNRSSLSSPPEKLAKKTRIYDLAMQSPCCWDSAALSGSRSPSRFRAVLRCGVPNRAHNAVACHACAAGWCATGSSSPAGCCPTGRGCQNANSRKSRRVPTPGTQMPYPLPMPQDDSALGV